MNKLDTVFRYGEAKTRRAGPWLRLSDLPGDLLAQARGRLRFVSLLLFCFCVAAAAIETLIGNEYSRVLYGVYAVNGLASITMYALARSPGLSDSLALRLGLVYEIVMCLVVSLGFPWAEYRELGTIPFITWVSIMIVVFPLLIPCPPRQTVVTALTAAATVPAGLALLQAAGMISVEPGRLVDMTITPLLCVVLAYAGSQVIYGLNVEVADARELGSYRLVDLLGRGGMGEVWRAEHKLLARPAAVKLISTGLVAPPGRDASGALVRRFEREARATAFLESPHTIDLYDFGTTDDGSFYYVMELLEGLDLETLVDEFGPVSAGRTVHILSQVCHSLAEAHERGLVHRDIKPTNIYLCRMGLDLDFVKVLDFGLVKPRFEEASGATDLTAAGGIVGTPAYFAPEMATSEEEVDGRADLYALGCVAYWLLTGTQVFEADSPLSMVLHHVRTKPDPVSARTEIVIPPGVESLVHRCLEKDPSLRPRSALTLAAELAEIELQDPWTRQHAEAWWALHLPELVTSRSVERHISGR